jgi:hypothetical protein
MNGSIALTAMLTAILCALGFAKILAIAPMRARAAHVGFSVAAYKRIGVLEVAPAVVCALLVAGYLAALTGPTP